MKRFTSFLVCLLVFGLALNAQDIQISGKVANDDGTVLPGVSVVIKGTTTGTTTNVNGEYELSATKDATLVFSFIGMKTKEVAVGGQSTINVAMEMEATGLDEVVVTALGISRDKKSLGYAVQELSGDDVNSVKNDNVVNSLSGKVAGVQVRNNTNMGGSSNIIIRGSSSLTQSNQALFVIDGVPVDNSNTNNAGQTTGRSGYDYGSAASDINPNDIESMTVLKGAAATALYGSRAANGVVLITTKKGAKQPGGKKVGVNVNSSVTFGVMDKSTFPEYQKEYGAGYGPYYPTGYFYNVDVDGDGTEDLIPPVYEDGSRGAKFDPELMVYQWDAFDPESPNYMKKTPWVAAENGPADFFNTAVSYTNSVDVSGGNDKTTYRLSYTNLDQRGIMPNSSLKRNNFNFSGTHEIIKGLKFTTSANYINTRGKGRNSTGYSDNIVSGFRQWWQVNADIKMLDDLYHKTGRNVTWNPKGWNYSTNSWNPQPSYWDNPYWLRYENYQNDERNRLISYAQVDWKVTDFLSFMGRASIDTYSELQEERKAVGSVAGELGVDRPDVTSGYSRYQRTFTETNFDLMANFNKDLTDKINVTGLLGTNIRKSTMDRVFASTNGGLAVAGLYSLNNSVDPMLPPEERLTETAINGVFGSVSLGYDNTFFVDATVRRDQSSNLPEEHNSYLYPSVSSSFIFSNFVEAGWLSLGKLRVNYAEVGNDPPALRVKDTYRGNAPFSGNSLATVHYQKNNEDLKPERQKSIEGGLEMKFFQNRLGFDLALYKTNTTELLMPVYVSWATGYRGKWVNAGETENKGVEIALYATPVKLNGFSWDVNVNWSKNESTVVSLFEDETGNEVKNLQVGSLQGGVTINARVGEPFGTIHGTDYQYHENGSRIVGANGRYLKTSANDVVIGDVNPDWNAGINNTLSYKNLSMSFLIDWQKGGDIFSLDMWYGIGTGLYEETAGNNELGNPKRDPIVQNEDGTYASNTGGILNEGVYEDGTTNTTRVRGDYYAADGWAVSPNGRFVYDASFVKLREVVLTYRLPSSLMERTFIQGASVSFIGSNLWIIHKNLPYSDPEASQGSGNIQGWQSGALPTTRNFGFSVNLQF